VAAFSASSRTAEADKLRWGLAFSPAKEVRLLSLGEAPGGSGENLPVARFHIFTRSAMGLAPRRLSLPPLLPGEAPPAPPLAEAPFSPVVADSSAVPASSVVVASTPCSSSLGWL